MKRAGRIGAWGRKLRAAAAATLALGAGSCAILPGSAPSHGPIGVMAVDEAEAGAIVSAYRASHGLTAVTLDSTLHRVAQNQADAMARADLLSHSVDGALPGRLAREGAEPRAMVENVSAGYGNLSGAIAGWKRSPAHNANLLFGPVRRMGIAAASAPGTRFKTFWALVMTD